MATQAVTSRYKIETRRLETGERYALIISRETRLPCSWACRYSHAYHRTRSINSGERDLIAISLLYEWCDVSDIDLDERLGSGRMLSAPEIEILSDHVRGKKVAPKIVNGKVIPRVVVGNTHKDRMKTIQKFIKWRMSHIVPAIVDTGKARDVAHRLREMETQVKGLVRASKQAQRESLTDEELSFLLAVTHPDHRLNPFTQKTKHRNYAIVLMLVELGVREGEPLVLKGQHVQLGGTKPRIVIVPNPDDPEDVRADAPQVKTNGRTLPLSRALASAVDHYATVVRPKTKGAKKQPFLFISTIDGAALSIDALYDIFVVLRDRFPDELPTNLSPHLLRHTWNSRFKQLASSRGWEEAFQKLVNNYLMGWTKTSEQSRRYGHSQIVREAEAAMMELQTKLLESAA